MAIALFPLLVSNTVSKNVVPGVCKVLENYLMVYGLEDILRQLRMDPATNKDPGMYSIRNNKLIKKENQVLEISSFLYNEILDEQSQIYDRTKPGNKAKGQTQQGSSRSRSGRQWYGQTQSVNVPDQMNVNIVQPASKEKDFSVRLDAFNLETLTLEPTWMKVDQVNRDGVKTSGIIGVKVVPYAVKSDASLSRLLMYDKQISKLQAMAIRKGRDFTTWLYKFWRKRWLVKKLFPGDDSVSGDPRKDIILKRSITHSKSYQGIFALANQAELSDDFTATAKGVRNLQKMGWGSFIIADDVNRRVSFCMKELKGLCSMMPYTMLYQTFSQAKVYEDIEDAKRTASSIFKVRRQKLSQIIGESSAQKRIEEFGNQHLPLVESSFLEEAYYIDEGLGDFMKKITPANLKTSISNIVKGKDVKQKAVTTTPEKVVKMATKLNPEFRKGYMLAKKVLSNTAPDVDQTLIDWAAISVAIRASVKKGGTVFLEEVKHGLKLFIKLFRRSKTKASLPKEHLVDATFGWVIIAFQLSVATFLASMVWYSAEPLRRLAGFLWKNATAATAGIDKKAVLDTAIDVGKAGYKMGSDIADAYGPWIGLSMIVATIIYLKSKK